MIFRLISRFLVNNERLVNKLAESYPVRRAAQLVIYFYSKGKIVSTQKFLTANAIEDTLKKIKERLENGLKK